MNPYDFVYIDWNRPPERHRPIWHHRFVGEASQPLYSGHLELDIYAETPIFISDPRSSMQDPKKPGQFIRNAQGEYIIPGSSLKGMLRNVVETLGNGCLTLFDGEYERREINYRQNVPESFKRCRDNTHLCIACRSFGMLNDRGRGIFLGKINIGDAYAYSDKVYKFEPMYTQPLMGPKPHHASFYLDEARQRIAGRKYYFHHSPDQNPLQENDFVYFGRSLANRYIQPLDRDTQFHARIDFTNLEKDEFAVLLLAIALEDNMCHKIGYGKPSGLGSISLEPISMTLVDYTKRYTQIKEGKGKRLLTGDAMWRCIREYLDDFYDTQLLGVALEDLKRIWRWPPDPDVDYYYPSKRDWFDTSASRGKRIADTRNVP